MGARVTMLSNKSMVDRLVEHHSYIHSPDVEGAFRAVDRAMYFDLEEGDQISPYDDDPWRRGNLHLSAPYIYARVVEALDLKPGLSFLNLGSGTGYLNTIVGLLLGANGLNYGIEIHGDVVDYANNRLQQFKEKSYAIDKFDFAEPIFVKGNCLNLNPDSKYDRIYLGAACLPQFEQFVKKLVKPNGGILVMPYEHQLMRHVRISENEWTSEKLMDVTFTLMIGQIDKEQSIEMPLKQAKSLKELCRILIRRELVQKVNLIKPELLHSDNFLPRRLRRARLKQETSLKGELRSRYKKQIMSSPKYKAATEKGNSQASAATPPSSSQASTDTRRESATQTSSKSDRRETRSSSTKDRGVLTRSASRRINTTERLTRISNRLVRDGNSSLARSSGDRSNSSSDINNTRERVLPSEDPNSPSTSSHQESSSLSSSDESSDLRIFHDRGLTTQNARRFPFLDWASVLWVESIRARRTVPFEQQSTSSESHSSREDENPDDYSEFVLNESDNEIELHDDNSEDNDEDDDDDDLSSNGFDCTIESDLLDIPTTSERESDSEVSVNVRPNRQSNIRPRDFYSPTPSTSSQYVSCRSDRSNSAAINLSDSSMSEQHEDQRPVSSRLRSRESRSSGGQKDEFPSIEDESPIPSSSKAQIEIPAQVSQRQRPNPANFDHRYCRNRPQISSKSYCKTSRPHEAKVRASSQIASSHLESNSPTTSGHERSARCSHSSITPNIEASVAVGGNHLSPAVTRPTSTPRARHHNHKDNSSHKQGSFKDHLSERKRKRHSSSDSSEASQSGYTSCRLGHCRHSSDGSKHLSGCSSSKSGSLTCVTRNRNSNSECHRVSGSTSLEANTYSSHENESSSLAQSSLSFTPPHRPGNPRDEVSDDPRTGANTSTGTSSRCPKLRSSVTSGQLGSKGSTITLRFATRCHRPSAGSSGNNSNTSAATRDTSQPGRIPHDSSRQSSFSYRQLKEIKSSRRSQRDLTENANRKRAKRSRRRRRDECERYHSHLRAFIRQLPLPKVLNTYLNYDRSL